MAVVMMLSMVGCGKKDAPVATIDGEALGESIYRAYLFSVKMQFEQFGPEIWDVEMDGETMEQAAKERALESAVVMSVTSKKAKEMNVELSTEDKDYAKQLATEYVTQLEEQLKDEGITEDTIRTMMEEILLSQKVSLELANKFVPTEDEEGYKQFVDENKMYFEKVKAQHVLINTIDENNNPLPEAKEKEAKKKAETVLEKALTGEDMGSLAKEYSQDPGSKDNNGEYTFGRGEMMPAFEEAAFSGEEGKVYPELVQTPYGYHIIKTVEKFAANEEEMKAEYKESQKSMYVNSEIDEWIKNAKVEKTELYDTIKIKRAETSEPGQNEPNTEGNEEVEEPEETKTE